MDTEDVKAGQAWTGSMHHEDGAQFEYSKSGPELRLFFSGLPDDVVDDFMKQPCQLGLLRSANIAVVPWKIGDRLSGDAHFHVFLYPPESRPSDPVLENGERTRVRLILIDRDAGSVRAVRTVSLSPELSQELAEVVSYQLGNHIGREAYDAQVAIYQNKYPDVREAMGAAQFFETVRD